MFESVVSVFYLVAVFSSAYAAGEFSVLHHPQSLVFKGHNHVRESTLSEVYSAALGFSTEQYSNWRGMYIEDPFNLAEAVVTLVVDGVSDIGLLKGHHFPLRTDEDESSVFNSLKRRISERYPQEETNIIRIDFSNGLEDLQQYNLFQNIKNDKPSKTVHNFLKTSVDEDREFLRELELLTAVINKVEKSSLSNNYVPDVFWFKLSSLHALQDLYGDNSTSVKEAKQLLNEAILQLNGVFKKIYGDSALVTVITSDASHTRKTRNILQAAADGGNTDNKDKTNIHNLSKNYDEYYPVIFNIILWFGVVMAFSLLAICIVIADMDPGRDSIIYRMTSNRMKKDN